jgi:GNAT superfamily N-acetyltransferase
MQGMTSFRPSSPSCPALSSRTGSTAGWSQTTRSAAAAHVLSTRGSPTRAGLTAKYTLPAPESARRCGCHQACRWFPMKTLRRLVAASWRVQVMPLIGEKGQVLAVVDEHPPPEPCWYLAFTGVDPAAQGHGIGSAMLAAVLERADREGFPAYLEASCPENQRLYERHGFITVGDLNVSDCPAIYPMWRSPAG